METSQINKELLAACKEALKCIAQLRPFPAKGAPVLFNDASQKAGDYADAVRDQLRQAIEHAERQDT